MKFEILNGSEGKMRERMRERGERGGRKEWIRKGWMGKGDTCGNMELCSSVNLSKGKE